MKKVFNLLDSLEKEIIHYFDDKKVLGIIGEKNVDLENELMKTEGDLIAKIELINIFRNRPIPKLSDFYDKQREKELYIPLDKKYDFYKNSQSKAYKIIDKINKEKLTKITTEVLKLLSKIDIIRHYIKENNYEDVFIIIYKLDGTKKAIFNEIDIVAKKIKASLKGKLKDRKQEIMDFMRPIIKELGYTRADDNILCRPLEKKSAVFQASVKFDGTTRQIQKICPKSSF